MLGGTGEKGEHLRIAVIASQQRAAKTKTLFPYWYDLFIPGHLFAVKNVVFLTLFFSDPYPRTCLLILERGEGRGERERKRNIDVRKKHLLVASYNAQQRTKPAT